MRRTDVQRHDEALACRRESLAVRREVGDLHGQAESLRELGVTLVALGRAEEARAAPKPTVDGACDAPMKGG